jgi:Na+/phosphate symporter
MTQTRKQSAIETVAGVAIGFVVSLAAAVIVFPLFGHAFTLGQNVGITIIFTVLSIARGYAVRRLFNRWGSHEI